MFISVYNYDNKRWYQRVWRQHLAWWCEVKTSRSQWKFNIGITYNELETMITVYFNALYQHFWPDLKSPWGDSCRAPVRTSPHRSPSEGCPNTCDCFAPANNTIQYNTIQYRASVTRWHGHYTKQTYLSKCLDIFSGNEHAWIHILQVPLEGLTVQPLSQILTFGQVPDVPLLIGNTILEY